MIPVLAKPGQPCLAYLFERFPSYNQTFCAREVLGVRALGLACPAYSIRGTDGEPHHAIFDQLHDTVRLPAVFDDVLATDTAFRRAARRGLEDLRSLWGDETDKRRVYEALWMKDECARRGITHVHAHFAGIAARTAFWLRRVGGPTFSVTAHANDIFRDEPPERLAAIFESAAAVITVSDFSTRFLLERFPSVEGKLSRVYNGVDMGRFKTATFPAGRPLIVSVGRLIEKKGFGDLIAACQRMQGEDFECRIVGDGPLQEELRAAITAAGLQDRVFLEGPLGEEAIAGLLARARVFALACVTGSDGSLDNLPTVIMEAMAAGLPVVSTRLAGIPEMVENGVTGLLVEEKSPGAFADCLSRFLTDRDLATRMGADGRARCSSRFSLSATASALIDALAVHVALPCRA